MDVLLLSCHFLFEQKQLSLQTPCSGGPWLLLSGSDLFTQPRDKVALPARPGATSTPTIGTTPLSSSYPGPAGVYWQELEPLSTLNQSGALSALGGGPGLIRSSMMK